MKGGIEGRVLSMHNSGYNYAWISSRLKISKSEVHEILCNNIPGHKKKHLLAAKKRELAKAMAEYYAPSVIFRRR